MDITTSKQDNIDASIVHVLGFNRDFKVIRNWLSNNSNIKQAFILNHSETDEFDQIVAYIEPIKLLATSEYQKFVEELKDELFAVFHGLLLPTTFVITDKLNAKYTIHEFKNQVLLKKFKDWQVFNTQINYWSRTLTNIPQLHNLPIDKSYQVNHKSSRFYVSRMLDSEIVGELATFCKFNQIDFFIVFQTLFSLLICRYSNDSEAVMSAKFTDISAKDNQLITDELLNDLILRTYLSGNPTVKEQLQYHQRVIQEAYLNRVPFSQLQQRIQLQEGLLNAITQINFHYQRVLSTDVEIFNAWLNSIYDDNVAFNYDIELSITNSNHNLFINWFYNANLFNQDTIVQIADSFEMLIKNAIRANENTVYSLPLIDNKKINSLVKDWNSTEIDKTLDSIQVSVEKQAYATPDAVALRFESESVTYKQLSQSAAKIAGILVEQNVKPGEIVAVCMTESVSLVTVILGILKSKASYLPLDPSFPDSRLDYVLKDSNVSTLVIENSINLNSTNLNIITISQKTISNLQNKNFIDKKCHDSNDVAYVMYTSGSTNEPKGVLGTHKSVMNRLTWMQREFSIKSEDIFCLKTSISSVDHVAEIFQPLIRGASLVIVCREEANQVNQLASIIEKHRVTRLTLLPSALKKLVENNLCTKLQSLKFIVSSGEPLHTYIADLLYKKLGTGISLVNLYGSTETGADVTYYPVGFAEDYCALSYFNSNIKHQFNADHPVSFLNQPVEIDSSRSSRFTAPNIKLDDLKLKFLESSVPNTPSTLEDYLKKLQQEVVPYLIDVSNKKYIGHMTSPVPSFIPEIMHFIAKANQNIVKIETAKGLTLVERQVLAMLHRMFFNRNQAYYLQNVQNPDAMLGVMTSGGSVANITALYCARNAALINQGVTKDDLLNLGTMKAMRQIGYSEAVILVSRLAHYSIKKAASLLGIGQSNLLLIEQDEKQKVNIGALEDLIDDCRQQGKMIIAIIGIAGATETGTIDPLDEMANIAKKHSIHFHVDAAWGGAFIFSDKYRHKLKGIERADSITVCAHKQLYISLGISVCLFQDPKVLFSIATNAEYQSKLGSYDLGQFTIEGSRPALSLLLHAALHLFSSQGYARLIDQAMEKTAFLRTVIEKSDCFQLVGENDLNIINYRYIPVKLRNLSRKLDSHDNETMDQATDLIQHRQFLEGKTFVSKTKILYKPYSDNKISVFRVVLANPNTSYDDILEVLQDQIRIASENLENQSAGNLYKSMSNSFTGSQQEILTVPIGQPIDNVKTYVLDHYLNPVPIGVTGELYIAGDCLAKGYLNQEQLNQTAFVKNPFCDKKALMFKSGDLVRRLPDKNIEYVGRSDLQVKLKGHRVKLHEVKIQLDRLNQIKDSIVLVENNLLNDNVLTAYIVLKHSSKNIELTKCINLIQSQLRIVLPEFMVPQKIKVFEQLPITPNGKINFKRL